MARIYVASSWRCEQQPEVVDALRAAGHEVYDFRNPPRRTGFAWSQIDPDWLGWSPVAYRSLLDDPIAVAGYKSDFEAMRWADTFVLVLPCGRSAHLELGWAAGQGKRTAILLSADKFEPELMYRMVDKLAVSLAELVEWVDHGEPLAQLPTVDQALKNLAQRFDQVAGFNDNYGSDETNYRAGAFRDAAEIIREIIKAGADHG